MKGVACATSSSPPSFSDRWASRSLQALSSRPIGSRRTRLIHHASQSSGDAALDAMNLAVTLDLYERV